MKENGKDRKKKVKREQMEKKEILKMNKRNGEGIEKTGLQKVIMKEDKKDERSICIS